MQSQGALKSDCKRERINTSNIKNKKIIIRARERDLKSKCTPNSNKMCAVRVKLKQ